MSGDHNEAAAAYTRMLHATNDSARASRVRRAIVWGGQDARDEARAFRQRAELFVAMSAKLREILAAVGTAELARDAGPRQLRRLEQSAVVFEAIAADDGAAAAEVESYLAEVSRAPVVDLLGRLEPVGAVPSDAP